MPDAARGVFPSGRLPLAERYVALLATAGVERGLLGPREVPRLWERHLLGCAVLVEAMREDDRSLVDLGSGAGLPGLAVALARPDLRVTLVEPLQRRTTFLTEVVDELGLAEVEVVRGRAEDLHGAASYDVVTSRAVAPLPRLLAWSMPLVAPRGRLLALKGARVHDEVAEAAPDLRAWEAAAPRVHRLGGSLLSPPTTVLEVSWARPERVGWPLRAQPAPPLRPGAQAAGRGSGGRRRRRTS